MIETRDGQVRVQLPAICDLPVAAELRQRLLEQMARQCSLLVVADSVERVSTPVIQVLMAATASESQPGHKLRITPSAVLREACAELGLAQWLAVAEAA